MIWCGILVEAVVDVGTGECVKVSDCGVEFDGVPYVRSQSDVGKVGWFSV